MALSNQHNDVLKKAFVNFENVSNCEKNLKKE